MKTFVAYVELEVIADDERDARDQILDLTVEFERVLIKEVTELNG